MVFRAECLFIVSAWQHIDWEDRPFWTVEDRNEPGTKFVLEESRIYI